MELTKYKEIISHLREVIQGSPYYGHLFAVGGCVRDVVMGVEPKDIDLVIDLPNGGIEFAEWMECNGHTTGSVVTYPTYGTAMFKLREFPDVELECVQTRKEQYKDKNSRNPETCHGTLEEDAYRRDLTINSLYYDVTGDKLLDPTGNGIGDIKNNVIRVTSTPDIVYQDDALRILRCLRFSSRFGWEIDKDTYDGMVRNVDRLSIITKERIQDELNKMLLCDRPVMAIQLMRKIGVMKYVIPEFEETYGLTQNRFHFGDVYEHTIKVLEHTPPKLELRMAALLHDIGKIKSKTVDENGNVHFYRHEEVSAEMCVEILRRLKYSNDFITRVRFFVRNHMVTKAWSDGCEYTKDKSLRKLQYKCGDYDTFIDLLTLIHADNISHATAYCMPNQAGEVVDRTRCMMLQKMDMFDYKLPIDGNDVMEAKGLQPGRKVKECLDYALKLAYNNPKMDRETMLKHIKGYKLK